MFLNYDYQICFKVQRNYFEKKNIETKLRPNFDFQKYIKISMSNLHQFFMKIASKNTSKQRRFFYFQI